MGWHYIAVKITLHSTLHPADTNELCIGHIVALQVMICTDIYILNLPFGNITVYKRSTGKYDEKFTSRNTDQSNNTFRYFNIV
jgi:hypothetical protein